MRQPIRNQGLSARFIAAFAFLMLMASTAQAQSGSESSVGYIDSAIPRSLMRLRYDSSYGNNRPDRAEFFWPGPSGPPFGESNVDFQDISAYLEWAGSPRFSAFVEVPVRFVNPEVNANAGGLSDISAGFKWALLAENERYFTFQLRIFAPSGDGHEGLGTNHVTLEPAVLFNRRLTDRFLLEGEFRDWIPVGGSFFAGNVLRYGLGVSYDTQPGQQCRLSPVVEFVGWTVLSGIETNGVPDIPFGAAGDTIVNFKGGLRMHWDECSDFYVGYGRALTGDVWYKDTIRIEYRFSF